MIQRLRNRGYVVELRGPWETVKVICKRLHISTSKFRRRMKRRHPSPLDVDQGPSGRISAIRSNILLDKFLVGANGEIKVPKRAKASLTLRIAPPDGRKRSKIA